MYHLTLLYFWNAQGADILSCIPFIWFTELSLILPSYRFMDLIIQGFITVISIIINIENVLLRLVASL